MLGRPAAVAYLLSLEPQQLRIPAVVTMTIAATRMHRSLVDFSNPNVCALLHFFFWFGSSCIMTNVILALPGNSK